MLAELAQPDAEYRSVPFKPTGNKSSLDLYDIAKALSHQLPKGLPKAEKKKKTKEKKEKREKEKEKGEKEKKEKGEKEKEKKDRSNKNAKSSFTFEVGNTAEVVEGAGEENKRRWCCYVRGKTPKMRRLSNRSPSNFIPLSTRHKRKSPNPRLRSDGLGGVPSR